MLRANSLKKAIRQIIEHTEKGRTSRWTGRVRETDQTDSIHNILFFCVFINKVFCFCVFSAVDEQNAQTQQQLFSLSRGEEEEGLVEEEEEEEEDDKVSLQSSYSVKHRNTRRGQSY